MKTKTLPFFSAGILFLVLTVLVYWIHVTYFRVNVVFYSAIFDGVIAALVTTVLVATLKGFRVFTTFEKFQMFLIWLITAYALAISLPAVIDRSLSFYILEKLQQRGGGIRLDRFSDVFTKEYLVEHRLVDVRLTEQSQSGTIRIDHGCVLLTPEGQRAANFSRFFRAHFLPKHRLLMGEYSDALVDPFKHSPAQMDYTCQ